MLRSGRMKPGDIAERHGRPEVDPTGRVVTAHDARHVGADCVETGDGGSIAVQYLGMAIGLEARECAEAARSDLHRIKRAVFDGGHAGVAFGNKGIALFAVVRRGATTERWVLTVAGVLVEVAYRFRQPRRIDTAGFGQRMDGCGAV